MCGIFFTLVDAKNNESDNLIDFGLLKKRGPDSFQDVKVKLEENLILHFAASVLSLRGGDMSQVTVQPLICQKSGNVLLWNGEIFASDLVKVDADQNDGFQLLKCLSENCENTSEKVLLETFESIKGPYAFVFYEKHSKCIYFGRDRLGRRSLLISFKNSNHRPLITLTSVKTPIKDCNGHEIFGLNEFQEVKANGIYKLDLKNMSTLVLNKWMKPNEPKMCSDQVNQINDIEITESDIYLTDSICLFNENVNDGFEDKENKNCEDMVERFYDKLKESVSRRVKTIPSFCKKCSHSKSNAIKFDKANTNAMHCEHAKVAVLFSGGVDSAVLAALADECIPEDEPIDLLNIAFEKQKSVNSAIKNNKREKNFKQEEEIIECESNNHEIKGTDEFLVPDRISGIECLKELNPKRKWNFVEINIGLGELRKERESVIKHLLYPHQTVLDDSIGCALWFASRGVGTIRKNLGENQTEVINYTSNAEVLLLGMGADEQLGGYARHRTRYDKEGIESFCNELKMEMRRISERNLGRDDRILSDHGKESRLPFLDEDVISFLNELKISEKCNMKLEKGLGEKYLLRSLAIKKFGLNFSSRLQKRAIQFGSRVAKIENTREKANDICGRITVGLNLSNSNKNDE